MNKIKLIIFDLDGTLTDSLADLTDAVNHMRAALGKEALSAAQVRKMVGQGARKLVERALNTEVPADVEQGLRLFLSYNDLHIAYKTTLYPGVVETLSVLAAQGKRLAVISNKNAALCRKLLDVLSISQQFEYILGADSLPERKPSPVPILKVLQDSGVSVGQTVMVGDSINDIAAGKGAGVITVGCTWGYGDPEELIEADYRIGSFSELLKLPIL